MSSAQTFKVCFEGDAAVESSLREWAAKKFVHSHLKNDQNGHFTLFCKYDQARTAKSFKLMIRNFAQHGGKIGTLLDLCLLAQDEYVAATDDSIKDDAAQQNARPRRPFSKDEAKIVAELPPEFDRKAKEKYERLCAIGACQYKA